MNSPQTSLADGHVVPRSGISRSMMAAIGFLLLIGLGLGSLVLGVRTIDPLTVIEALLAYDPTLRDHLIVWDYRLPRMMLAMLCGSAFGVAGALIQAATRNPLADPGLLGVNAGAAFFVTLAVGVLGWQSIDAYLWAAFAGAIVVTLLVYAIGAAGREGATPVRLVLSGVALSAVLGGIGSAVILLDPQAFEAMRQWSVGSVSGRDMHVVMTITPFIATGLVVALIHHDQPTPSFEFTGGTGAMCARFSVPIRDTIGVAKFSLFHSSFSIFFQSGEITVTREDNCRTRPPAGCTTA